MATVPSDEIGTVQQEALPGRAIPRLSDDASPAAFGAGLGQGLEQAAGDIEQVDARERAAQKQLQDKANQDADRVQLAGAITNLSRARDQIQFGKDDNDPDAAFRQTGKALATLPQTAGAKFDDAAQEISSNLTPHQQSMFSERVAGEKDNLDLQLRRYQFEQSNREATEAFGNAKAQSIQSASNNYRDPAATPQAREDLLNAGMALAARGGKASIEAYKEQGYAHDLDALHEGVIGANLADNKVAGAQAYLNKWGSDLSSGTVRDTLQNRINAERDRLENKEKESARNAYADALAGARAGIAGSSSLVSDRQLGLIHQPEGAARARDFLNQASDVGAAGKKIDQMTPAAAHDLVESYKPTVAKPGVANQLELYGMLQREEARSINQRNADPRQFVTSTSGQQELDLSKPIDQQAQLLNSRFNTQMDTSKKIGTYVPPLSTKEAQHFTQTLESQSSDKKLGMLNQYRQSLGDDRFTALMQQVRPESPVTVKAALLLPRDPATAASWYDVKHDTQTTTARTIMQGQDIINPGRLLAKQDGKGGFKSGIDLPIDSKFRTEWNASDGVRNGVYAGNPKEADAQFEATKSYYAARVAMTGKTGAEVDSDIWDEAVKAVAGTTDSHFGGTTVPVPRGMDPARFPDYVNNAMTAIEKGWGLKPGSTKGLGLQEIGDYGSGRYGLVHDGKQQQDDKGNWVTIDLNQQYRAKKPNGG